MINGSLQQLIVLERKKIREGKQNFDMNFFNESRRNTNAASYRILFGLHDRLNQENWVISRNVQRIVMHPSYVSQNFVNDIALMQLSVMGTKSMHI